MDARAAVASVCIGCGSYFWANSMISSAERQKEPSSRVVPSVKSSKYRKAICAIYDVCQVKLSQTQLNSAVQSPGRSWLCIRLTYTRWPSCTAEAIDRKSTRLNSSHI